MNIILEVKKMLKMSLQNKKLFQHTQIVTQKPRVDIQCYFSPKRKDLEERLGKKQKQKYHRDRNNKNYQRDYYIVHEPGIKK